MQTDPRDGSAPPEPPAAVELDTLRTSCHRLRHDVAVLNDTLSHLRSGADALALENAGLRRELAGARARVRLQEGQASEFLLALDAAAPRAARGAVASVAEDVVPPAVLECAQLVVSELVTNSVVHSLAAADEPILLRVECTDRALRLEVEDSGAGRIAVRPPHPEGANGFGLNIVELLSARWGAEHHAGGSTRVWAELTPATSIALPTG